MSSMQGPTLPTARLQPKDGADRLNILKGQVRDGARTTGRVAGAAAKTLAMVALCGAGLFAVGSGRMRTNPDFDRRLENLRRMNESTMRLLNQPKIDWDSYYRSLDLVNKNHQLDFRRDGLDWSLPKPSTRAALSPAQQLSR